MKSGRGEIQEQNWMSILMSPIFLIYTGEMQERILKNEYPSKT